MSTNNVLRLEEYRDRRSQRLRLQMSLCQSDRGRAALLGHLVEVTRSTGTDRAAIVWVDEYGPGMVHPHVVLDLVSDRPRRSFALEPLRRAWDTGVPGVFCDPGDATKPNERTPWTLAVALGSDGSRAWFMVADALVPPVGLDEELRGRVMFLAGECSALVLHRDLDVDAPVEVTKDGAKPGFAGWPILKDIEGREEDDIESRRIALRFIVARLPRLLVEDDLAVPAERLREQAQRARAEIKGQLGGAGTCEEGLWTRILDSFQEADLETLAERVVELGEAAEAGGHLHGAVELFRTAYEIAAGTGAVPTAVLAARYSGRVHRKLAKWSEAYRWYGVARGVAEAAGMDDSVAVVLDGIANTQRERGNLPAARATLEEALSFAERAGENWALGSVYHGLMNLEHQAGDLERSLEFGWLAVSTFDSVGYRVRALASLGGVLVDAGRLDAGEDAWTVVSRMSDEQFYQVYAFDALAYIAALKGDADTFRRRAAEADALDWENGSASAKAEILLYRGLSYRALGELGTSRAWLLRAVSYAEAEGFSQTLFQAEEALRGLMTHDDLSAEGMERTSPSTAEVCDGLKALRLEFAAAPF